jgi:hypothetical protein
MGDPVSVFVRLNAATVVMVLLLLLRGVQAGAGALDPAIPPNEATASRRARLRSLPISAPRALRMPRRVLLLGDSLGASLDAGLTAAFAEHQIEFEYGGYRGTGPLSYQGGFWQAEMTTKLVAFRPDIVIIQASGNYNMGGSNPFVDEDGKMLAQGSADFLATWEHKVLELVDQASEQGVTTVILTAPVVADFVTSHQYSDEHNAGYSHVARKSGAVLLDWNRLLAPDGQFQATITIDGVEVALRSTDGLHFAETGIPVVVDWLVDQILDRTAATATGSL